MGIPRGSDDKESACSVGEPGLIPGQEDLLENRMVAHSSTLEWRIPWTEEPVIFSPWDHKKSDATEYLTLPLPLVGEIF